MVMNGLLTAGIVLTGLGVLGYATGIVIPYPGRSLSVTALMIGITLIAISRSRNGQEAVR